MKFPALTACSLLLTLCLAFSTAAAQPNFNRHSLSGIAQGTTWTLSYFSSDSIISKFAIDSLLASLDKSLSIYQDSSLISKFNRSEKGAPIDKHLFNVVSKSLEIYRRTSGRFDITVKPLVELWGFASKKTDHVPDSLEVRSVMPCIGSRYLSIAPGFLAKKKACTEIDVNGIAQGYSVDVLADYLESRGIENYVVELGGELRIKGHKADHAPIRVGIESPVEDVSEPALVQRIVALNHGALTTSGSYRKYYESNGKRISHIIDPFTGYSAVTDLISVTVFARDAITADGFDNAILMMGLKKGLRFVENHKRLAAFFIYKDASGQVQSLASSRFKSLLVPE